jgi:subtilisin family serine protease
VVASAGNRSGDGATKDEGGGDDDDEGEDEDDGGGTTTGCDPSQIAVKYPARYDEWVIAVAATDHRNKVADYSRSGPELDVVAPGGSRTGKQILSTAPDGGYVQRSGTSQATAHVTGATALALQR